MKRTFKHYNTLSQFANIILILSIVGASLYALLELFSGRWNNIIYAVASILPILIVYFILLGIEEAINAIHDVKCAQYQQIDEIKRLQTQLINNNNLTPENFKNIQNNIISSKKENFKVSIPEEK